MFEDIIRNFTEQLNFDPVIENAGNFQKRNKFVVCGMGGSNLAAGIIKSCKPGLDIIIHRDYSLPEIDKSNLKERLIICSSYSGNTEEAISSFNAAREQKLSLIVIGTGGQLIEAARTHNIPFIKFPEVDNLPRLAIGYSIAAILKAMGEESILNDIGNVAATFKAGDYEPEGKELAEKLQNKIPVIYSSGQNAGLARYWKISFNETSKLPAFYNFLPELNHNEMAGFGSKIFDSELNHKFAFIFLTDPEDEPHIQKRMEATRKIFENKGFMVSDADSSGRSFWQKSFASLATAMWASYFLAEYYGVAPEDISMIEDFKKLIK